MTATHLYDLDAETGVVGACVMSDVAARNVVDLGLRPHMFASAQRGVVFTAVQQLVARSVVVDIITVCDQLETAGKLEEVGGKFGVERYVVDASPIGSIREHARIVMDRAKWRHRHNTSLTLAAAAQAMDHQAFEQAENDLTAVEQERRRHRTFGPQDVGAAFLESLDKRDTDRFEWPFDRLNQKSRGGARRGQVTVLSGPITHGKSAFVDMCLESMHRPGRKVHLYLNEMTAIERAGRIAARTSGVDLTTIDTATAGGNELDQPALTLIRKAMERQPIGITECDGWTAERICRHARRHEFDVIAVDIVQRLPFSGDRGYSRTHQLDAAANQFDQLAKACRMHVILVAHINRERARSTGRAPIPSMTDIKDCAALVEVADNVLFVWRKTDPDTTDPEPEGTVRFAKCRGGEQGGLEVRFDGEHQRFLQIDRRLEAVA